MSQVSFSLFSSFGFLPFEPGSRAGTHRKEEKNKNILTGRKKTIFDTHRSPPGRP
jgi:hypothetical protein